MAVEEPTPAPTPTPRYIEPIMGMFIVTSPPHAGTQTQSVRSLTKNQVESYTARGYDLKRAPPGTTPKGIVNLTTKRYGITYYQKRKFAGIPRTWTQSYQGGQTIVKRPRTKVTSSLRLVQEPDMQYHNNGNGFSMPSHMFSESNVRYWHAERNRYVHMTPSTASRLKLRTGWTLTRVPETTGQTGARSDRTTTQSPTQTQLSNDVNVRLQKSEQELINLKKWVEEVNQRLSSQMIAMGEAATALGQSTVHRTREIQSLDEWSQLQIKRIDETLINLGNAVTDASKAAASIKAENTIKQVGNQIEQKAQGLTGGIKKFISQPTNMIMIGAAVMIVIMIVIKMKS